MQWVDVQVSEIAEVSKTIDATFSGLGVQTMDFKLDAETWSINECFDHVVQSNKLYDPIFTAIAQGTYEGSQGVPFLSRLAGRLLLKVVSPDYKGKFKTSPSLYPLQSTYDANITHTLVNANDVLIDHFRRCEGADLDNTVVVSPVNKWVTYSLRECITLLVDHEKRHLNQALRLKEHVVQHIA